MFFTVPNVIFRHINKLYYYLNRNQFHINNQPKKKQIIQMSNQKQKKTSSGDFIVYFSPNSGKPIQMRFKQMKVTVKEVIQNCLKVLSDQYLLNINMSANQYALFGANKEGKKLEDIPCISQDQKIKGTGIRRFYLQNLMLKCNSFISTQINLQMKYGIKQTKNTTQNKENCCMWFKFPLKN